MSAIHTALKALGPVPFSDLPTDPAELDTYISDLFTQSQLILESIPIVEPVSKDTDPSDPTPATIAAAKSAAEIKPSLSRSAQPIEEYASLQKEWGKPMKLGSKENALGMSVYKLSGKDGRGAWFARRSVHEGLGFSRFKRAMQQEFEESLAVQGAPGEGNIRGIGGEERVESIDVPGRGKVEVFRLSAQFPGPTTPRDFVTLLVTSDNGMKPGKEPTGQIPRHYMVISKPCDHPDTQPRDGFIRGSYESVEFIREVPRKLKTSMSTTDLERLGANGGNKEEDLGRAAAIRNAQQRERSVTAPLHPAKGLAGRNDEDESNPVEWIMVTRSDPGGSVPRFMVERGTPSSICQDASKFLDWACQQQEDEVGEEDAVVEGGIKSDTAVNIPTKRPSARRESFQSFRSSRLAGLEGNPNQTDESAVTESGTDTTTATAGLMGTVVGAVTAYTPQVVLDHLPGHTATTSSTTTTTQSNAKSLGVSKTDNDEDDSKSILSTTSFQSAEDHLTSSEESDSNERDSHSIHANDPNFEPSSIKKSHTQHEKELQKLEDRRISLETKFAESRTKLESQISSSTQKEQESHRKAQLKHEKDLAKHEEKYRKEIKKLEDRQEKERKKLEEKQKKQENKNEITRVTRERDEARKETQLLKDETEQLKKVIADLQKENNALVAKLGTLVPSTTEKGSSSKHSRSNSGSSRRVTVGSSHSNLSQSSGIIEEEKRGSNEVLDEKA